MLRNQLLCIFFASLSHPIVIQDVLILVCYPILTSIEVKCVGLVLCPCVICILHRLHAVSLPRSVVRPASVHSLPSSWGSCLFVHVMILLHIS